jgi:sugar lactone lactonase YvrE
LNEVVETLLDVKNVVGESIIFDDRRNALFWVDIIACEIHTLDLKTAAHRVWKTPEICTSIGLRADGGFVVGLTKNITLWDQGHTFDLLAQVEPNLPDNRLNEGVVGPDGAYWVGTMQNNMHPDGSPRDMTGATGHLYRVAPDGSTLRLSDDPFGISNTLAWTTDNKLLVADTLENEIYKYQWESGTNRLSGRQVHFPAFDRGLPDGSCLDADGYLWNCRVVGGNCVIRIAPDGAVDRVVELPCSWPTSCTFGGPDYAMLYITSARFTQSNEHLATVPWEGGVFAIDVGMRGRPSNRFG